MQLDKKLEDDRLEGKQSRRKGPVIDFSHDAVED
jgi:hypothetical protein